MPTCKLLQGSRKSIIDSFDICCFEIFNTHSTIFYSRSKAIYFCETCLYMELTQSLPVHGFGATCKGTSQNLSTLSCSKDTGRRQGFIYSTNIYDKIRPIRVLPRAFFSLLFNVPFILAVRSCQNVCLVPPEGSLSTL